MTVDEQAKVIRSGDLNPCLSWRSGQVNLLAKIGDRSTRLCWFNPLRFAEIELVLPMPGQSVCLQDIISKQESTNNN